MTDAEQIEVLERVQTPRGELVLRRAGEHFEVISNGTFLMDTRDGRSERLLVSAALAAADRPRSLLIGGLGVGFSLCVAVAHASLERIDVVEIEPALVGWHDAHLRELTGDARADPRVSVHVTDLADHAGTHLSTYDVMCVDVDNGPTWTVTPGNDALYSGSGTATLLAALRPGGVLAVWSAMPVPSYEQLLRRLAARVEVLTVDVAPGGAVRADPDVIYLACRSR